MAQPPEMDIDDATPGRLTSRSTFLTTEDVLVGVDPVRVPEHAGQTADIYVVAGGRDSQWSTNTALVDVTGRIETITVKASCSDCWRTVAWSAPLAKGRYDVVLDFNRDGRYTPGTDLIDSLVGFTVADVRVDQISFNYTGSGAVTLFDPQAAANVTAPEYSSVGQAKPAAWVMGGNHSVRVRFAAVPTLASAEIWADGGLDGLASSSSPVTVTFSGGVGQADFPVASPPAAVARTRFTWDWKYDNGASITEMGSTGEHLLYSVLAAPKAPQATPWVGALDVAAGLAQGETTAAGVTRKIWDGFYHNAGALYDTINGSPRYTGSTNEAFNLTLWLANYKSLNIGVVNCYDMGKSVVVFANALGASAEYVHASSFGFLNLVNAVGRGWTNNPFYDSGFCNDSPVVDGDWGSAQGRCGFGNHSFARLGGQIYDASAGQVDTDANPDTLAAGAPHDLAGADNWLSSYRSRVIDNLPASNPATPAAFSFDVY